MEVKIMRTVALEVFKTLNYMDPEYMREMLHITAFTTHRPLNLDVNKNHANKYENKTLRYLGLHI